MAKKKPRFPDRKISDAFLLFSTPLLESLGPDLTEARMEQTLQLTWAVWNAVVFADAAQKTHSLDLLRSSMVRAPESKLLVEALIERKRTEFGDDHRIIGEYSLFRQEGELRLRAEARDPGRKS